MLFFLSAIFLGFLIYHAWAEKRWEGERAVLVKMLRSPEAVVAEEAKHPPPPRIPFDDDAALMALQQKRETNGN